VKTVEGGPDVRGGKKLLLTSYLFNAHKRNPVQDSKGRKNIEKVRKNRGSHGRGFASYS